MRFLWESITTVAMGGYVVKPVVSDAHGSETVVWVALAVITAVGLIIGVNALYEWVA